MAMKRVVEAAGSLSNSKPSDSQRDAYEKTFLERNGSDGDYDDEGIKVVSDWIAERVHAIENIPWGLGSSDGMRRGSAGRTGIRCATTSGLVSRPRTWKPPRVPIVRKEETVSSVFEYQYSIPSEFLSDRSIDEPRHRPDAGKPL